MTFFIFLLLIFPLTLPATLAFPPASHPCFVEDEACEIHEENFLQSVSGVHSVEECRQLCYEDAQCAYISYFGQESFPFREVCMLVSDCSSRHACQDCITEDKFCYTTCSDNVEGSIGENIVDILPDIEEELLCKLECNNNPGCNFYTHHNSTDPDYANLCILLTEIQQPLKVCQFCSTGTTECLSRKMCGLMVGHADGGTNITTSSLFTSTSTTVTIHPVSVGRCQITILSIGGGGMGGRYNSGNTNAGGGGGSGEVSMISYIPGRSSDLIVKVGGPGQNSTVTTSGGEIILVAEAGNPGDDFSGGDGYSGGGGDGYSGIGAGGSNGGNGEPGSNGNGGVGSGLDVSLFVLDHFYITPGTGGHDDCGGGGGGLLINGTGPSRHNGQGQGYGGGGEGCQNRHYSGLQGAILIEI